MFTIPWTNEDVKISTLWGSFGRADLVSDIIWLSKVANYWSRDFKLARTIESRMTFAENFVYCVTFKKADCSIFTRLSSVVVGE